MAPGFRLSGYLEARKSIALAEGSAAQITGKLYVSNVSHVYVTALPFRLGEIVVFDLFDVLVTTRRAMLPWWPPRVWILHSSSVFLVPLQS